MSLLESIQSAGQSGKLMKSTVKNMRQWVEGNFLPDWALRSLEELLAQEAFEELDDRFYKNMQFGTGGMRGRTIGQVSADSEKGTPSKQGSPAHAAIGSNVLNDLSIHSLIRIHGN